MRTILFYVMCFLIVPLTAYAGTDTVSFEGVALDTASVLSLATIILTAIGAIWGIKKLIKLANRS